MLEFVSKAGNEEYPLETGSLRPEHLQTAIDTLTNYGRQILVKLYYGEGQVKVFFPEAKLGQQNPSVSILIHDPLDPNHPPARRTLQLRKPDSTVETLRQYGVNFGVSDQGIIVKATYNSQKLTDKNEANKCLADLKVYLCQYPALVTVKAKIYDEGEEEFHWQNLPQANMFLKQPLLSAETAEILKDFYV